MTGLIIKGVILLIFLGALYGAKVQYDNKIRANERAKYSALIDKCAKRTPTACAEEWTTAIDANVTLQQSLELLRTASRSCSAETQKGGDLTAKAEADKERRLAHTEGYREGLKQSRAELETRLAAAVGPAKTCEQTLTSVGIALKSVAVQRIRFALGFEDAPPSEGGVTVK